MNLDFDIDNLDVVRFKEKVKFPWCIMAQDERNKGQKSWVEKARIIRKILKKVYGNSGSNDYSSIRAYGRFRESSYYKETCSSFYNPSRGTVYFTVEEIFEFARQCSTISLSSASIFI